MSTDDRHSDNDLKAYLDGRDGVSAAYRKTANEEPPRALDQAILNAARKRAQPSTPLAYPKRRPYALAASFMVAVVAVSLYFSQLDEIVVPAAVEEATVRAVQLQRADAPEADNAAGAAVANAPPPQTSTVPALDFERRRLAPTAPTVASADRVAAPAAPAAARSRDAFARAEAPQPVVIDGPLLEEIEAEAAAAQAQQGAAAESTLEEITVTGARIMRRDEGDVSYRESREDWLGEISNMTDELDARSRLTTARAAAARLEAQLNEEIELYIATYPDADIEAELAALEE